MARFSWLAFLFNRPISIFRHHFYKILVFIVFALLAAQYGLNMLVFQPGRYFFFNSSSPTLYSNSSSKDNSVNLLQKPVVTLVKDYVLTTPYVVVRSQAATTFATTSTLNLSVAVNTSKVTVLQGSNVVTLANNATPVVESVLSNKTNLTIVTKSNDSSVSNMTAGDQDLPLCPLVPPKLVGAVKVWTEPPSMEELEKMHPELELGGRFRPKECKSRHKVAIIIPYRDRDVHLRMFLHNLHPILQRQQLDYGIYVIEQNANTKFNRAKLMNVGFAESLLQYNYSCMIFHDVDLLPEDDRNLYSCPEQPRHMSVAIDVFNYRLPYDAIFGGVSALTKEQFEKINGFSNQFWGWGGEDDDMANRISYHGYHVSRYPTNIARYKMMKHKKDQPNPDRYNKLYKGKQRFKTDGLNSLHYKRLDLLLKRLYTLVQVDLLQK